MRKEIKMKKKVLLTLAAVVILAATFAAGLLVGRSIASPSKDVAAPPRDTEGPDMLDFSPTPAGHGWIPPVPLQIIGTLKESEGPFGTCVLDVTAVYEGSIYSDSKASKFPYAGKLTTTLADGSTWDFTPGESLSFTYSWCGNSYEPTVGDTVCLYYGYVDIGGSTTKLDPYATMVLPGQPPFRTVE